MTQKTYSEWLSTLELGRTRAYAEIVGAECPWFANALFAESGDGSDLFGGDVDVPSDDATNSMRRAVKEDEMLRQLCSRMNKSIADRFGDEAVEVSRFETFDLGQLESAPVFRVRVEFQIKAKKTAGAI